MHLTCIISATLAALAGTAVAFPKFSGPYHGLKARVPGNETSTASKASASGTSNIGVLTAGSPRAANKTHDSSTSEKNRDSDDSHLCLSLCALNAQACAVTLPNDEEFCWEVYLECSERCDPEDIH